MSNELRFNGAITLHFVTLINDLITTENKINLLNENLHTVILEIIVNPYEN